MKKIFSFLTAIFLSLVFVLSVSAETFVAPSIKAVPKGATQISVTWSKVNSAQKYNLYILRPDEKTYKLLGSTANLYHTVGSLNPNTSYKFKVRAVGVIKDKNILGDVSISATASTYKSQNKWLTANFTNSDRLNEHYAKHKSEFGEISKDEYLAKARILLSSKIGGNILGFTAKDGTLYRYDKTTNLFSVGSAKGNILTLFKPDDEMKYYERQIAKNG